MSAKMTGKKDKFRYELKYVISDLQIVQLQERLRNLMPLDRHVGAKGYYTIRSLYFDDYYNRAFYEKEDGTDPREKFRLRYYDGNTDLIHLEIKRKVRGKIQKESSRVTKAEADAMITGDWAEVAQNSAPVVQNFFLKGATGLMQPKVIVEYDRVPYVYPDGNVRVTIDRNIRAFTSSFWREDSVVRPIMPAGQHLLEVKFDEFLPDFIYRTLQLENLTQTAFSKYYLCRKFGSNPG